MTQFDNTLCGICDDTILITQLITRLNVLHYRKKNYPANVIVQESFKDVLLGFSMLVYHVKLLETCQVG